VFPLLCAITCGLTNIIVACSIKGAQHANSRPATFGSIASGIAFLSFGLSLPFFKGSSDVTGAWIIGAVLGILSFASITMGIYANAKGPPSIAWSIANMGLLVPIAISAFYFGETLHAVDYLLLMFFILMLVFFHRGIARAKDISNIHPLGYGMLLLAVFMVNGLLMFCFKLNAIYFPEANKMCLLVATYGSSFLLFTAMMFFQRRKQWPEENIWVFPKNEVKWGMGLGISIGITQILMQESMVLPAIVSFPVIQGISLLGGVAFTSYIYHEIFNIQKTVGVILGLIVVLLSIAK
jgi:hypothetical protein